MTAQSKILQLKSLIEEILTPLIKSDYYLLEAPYYRNIGDVLIWQGEMDYLKTLPYKCKGIYSGDTFRYPKIKEDDILLMQGGGNFGDLYPWNHNFKMDVIKHYPNNRVIIFPQTVWFEQHENLLNCAEFLSHYPKVTICARDQVSYKFLREYFKNEILLLPDMAFCVDIKKWDSKDNGGKDLFLKRDDGELKITEIMFSLENRDSIDITDWPSMLKVDVKPTIYLQKLKDYCYRHHNWFVCGVCDLYAYHFYRKYLINLGVHLIRNHNRIYTTRLHTAILSVLLDKKEIIFVDNSYGKNSNFYNTWLTDCDNIQLESDV